MTRNEFYSYVKKYGIAILIALPILIGLNILMVGRLKLVWMVVIDCVVLFGAFIVTLELARVYRNHITKKRTEFLMKKEQEKRWEQVKEAEKKDESESEQKERIIIKQKQKKNYPSIKRKRK